MNRLFILTALIALTANTDVYAAGDGAIVNEDLVVTDCKGTVRATAQVEPGSLSLVQLVLSDSTELAKISLAQSNREKKVAVAHNSSATFESVTAGKWSACVENSDVSITKVSIVPGNTQALSSLPLVGLSALGGGLAVAGIAGGNGSDSNNSGPVTSLVGQTSNVIADNSSPSESATAASRTGSASECLNSETPDPLSPFF